MQKIKIKLNNFIKESLIVEYISKFNNISDIQDIEKLLIPYFDNKDNLKLIPLSKILGPISHTRKYSIMDRQRNNIETLFVIDCRNFPYTGKNTTDGYHGNLVIPGEFLESKNSELKSLEPKPKTNLDKLFEFGFMLTSDDREMFKDL